MKSDKIKGILILSIPIIILFVRLYTIIDEAIIDRIFLAKEYRYTILKTIFYGGSNKASGTSNKYTFMIKNKWYSGYSKLPLKRDGTKYFIKYYPSNPSRNEATLVIVDSTDIADLPEDGYKELPHN